MEEKPIVLMGVRILRPWEANALIRAIKKPDYQIMFKALLFSGMRYVEMQRFQRHPEWFDGKHIHLPREAVKKAKRKQKERWVRLNPRGEEVISAFLRLNKSLPTWQTWRENLRRWGESAGLDPVGLSPKTTRKTWESWLAFYYPQHLHLILLSQGHTALTSIQHYLNMPFTERDKMEMREFVEGWV